MVASPAAGRGLQTRVARAHVCAGSGLGLPRPQRPLPRCAQLGLTSAWGHERGSHGHGGQPTGRARRVGGGAAAGQLLHSGGSGTRDGARHAQMWRRAWPVRHGLHGRGKKK